MNQWLNQCHLGDCLDVLREMPDSSVDAVVTDPPYGLSFMGKRWDYDVPAAEVWSECLRVLKPGGHLLAFAGTRAQHRMAVRIEDAGFEIRDMIAWVYGSGFPKSLDVSKALDKAAGAEREVVGLSKGKGGENLNNLVRDGGNDAIDAKGCGAYGIGAKQITIDIPITAPATEAARQWQGWGTALKPAMELITMARKPLGKGMTVAANVLEHGTGALNIDGCRVEYEDDCRLLKGGSYGGNRTGAAGTSVFGTGDNEVSYQGGVPEGRWPANLIHDGSVEVLAAFPIAPGQQGPISTTAPSPKTGNVYGAMKRDSEASQDSDNSGVVGFKMKPGARRLDDGSAARFFYCAKASSDDRNEGLHGFSTKQQDAGRKEGNPGGDNPRNRGLQARKNHHPTVKPTDLMRYLVRLVTPVGGIVLDPFMGSGTTCCAAVLEGLQFVGIEREAEYIEIARARIASAARQGFQPSLLEAA